MPKLAEIASFGSDWNCLSFVAVDVVHLARRYLTGPTSSAIVERLESIGLPRFEGRNSDLHLTGLLKPLIRALDPKVSLPIPAAEAADSVDPLAVPTRGSSAGSANSGGKSESKEAPVSGIPVVGCFLFCMEGINFGQGAQMAQCANALLDILPAPVAAEGGGGADTSQAAGDGGEKAPAQLWHTPPTWTMPLAAADPSLF